MDASQAEIFRFKPNFHWASLSLITKSTDRYGFTRVWITLVNDVIAKEQICSLPTLQLGQTPPSIHYAEVLSSMIGIEASAAFSDYGH